MNIRRSAAVARREYLERVRTKAFWIGTVVVPAITAAMLFGGAQLMARQMSKPLRIAVADAEGDLQNDIENALEERKIFGRNQFLVHRQGSSNLESRQAQLKESVLRGELDGFVYLPAHALDQSLVEYYGKSVGNRSDIRNLESVLEQAFLKERLLREGVTPSHLSAVTRRVDLKTIRVTEGGDRPDRGLIVVFASGLMMMLYVAVVVWGQTLMTSVIDEKSNRVFETILSSITHMDLFVGKMVGVGSAGLTQLAVWALLVFVAGASSARAASVAGLDLPDVTPFVLGSFIVFFILGYSLYGALFLAIGAAVNTIQDAQNLSFPAMLPLIASVLFFPVVVRSPDSVLSVGLSLFPFATPVLMFLRITISPPSGWQVAVSIVLTALTVAVVIWGSSRVYRVGILMYGKRPTFPEIVRWVRHS